MSGCSSPPCRRFTSDSLLPLTLDLGVPACDPNRPNTIAECLPGSSHRVFQRLVGQHVPPLTSAVHAQDSRHSDRRAGIHAAVGAVQFDPCLKPHLRRTLSIALCCCPAQAASCLSTSGRELSPMMFPFEAAAPPETLNRPAQDTRLRVWRIGLQGTSRALASEQVRHSIHRPEAPVTQQSLADERRDAAVNPSRCAWSRRHRMGVCPDQRVNARMNALASA